VPRRRSSNFDENDLIRLVRQRFAARRADVVQGIGDDAAVVLPAGAEEFWLITTDMLLENVDFRREWTGGEQIGHKALAVNLSDVAAMGGRPRFYTIALGMPPGTTRKWIADFYRGVTSLGAAEGAALIGGDLSRSESIHITITLIGETAGRKILYRSGGKAGDYLYVTGTLGKAAAGLRLLSKGFTRPASGGQACAIRALTTPNPRCAAGFWLAQSGFATSMMDISDGLSVDLPRLCSAAKTGAVIDARKLPLFLDSAAWKCDPLELALHGGEAFELLFSVPAPSASKLEKSYPKSLPKITRIGRLTADRGDVLYRRAGRTAERLPARGFDHFRVPGRAESTVQSPLPASKR
jgi:thiamine-monophosphate kinase